MNTGKHVLPANCATSSTLRQEQPSLFSLFCVHHRLRIQSTNRTGFDFYFEKTFFSNMFLALLQGIVIIGTFCKLFFFVLFNRQTNIDLGSIQ